MSYSSYDTARTCHSQFLLDAPISLSTMLPHRFFSFGRPPAFPLPALFVLLGLKFDSASATELLSPGSLSYLRSLNALVFLSPSHSVLQQALRRLDTRLLHRIYRLVARTRHPPRAVAADSTGFSHSTGGEWLSLRFRKTLKRRPAALHAIVDSDTLLVHAARAQS